MRVELVLFFPLAISAATIQRRLPQHHHDHSDKNKSTPLRNDLEQFGEIKDEINKLIGPGGPLQGQSEAVGLLHILPVVNATRTRDRLDPRYKGGAKRKATSYGPFTLVGRGKQRPIDSAWSHDPLGQSWMNLIKNGICRNCTIIAVKATLSHPDGSDATNQDVYIHHILARDISKHRREVVPQCGIGPDGTQTKPLDEGTLWKSDGDFNSDPAWGPEFFNIGNDQLNSPMLFTTADGSYSSGFHVGPNDVFMMQADLVNYSNENRTVYVTLDIEYLEGHVGSDVQPGRRSVTGCEMNRDHGTLNTSLTGPAATESLRFQVQNNGAIIFAMGHMHDGGTEMILYLNDNRVCTSSATYGHTGIQNEQSIVGMSLCDVPITVKKDDMLRMTAIYDLSKHPIRVGGDHSTIMDGMDLMGMFELSIAYEK